MDRPQLEIDIYQLAGDETFLGNRRDGSGWDWCWADWQRPWMDATPNRHAYRCLPLTIANQTGWWIKNPVGFEAVWTGSPRPGSIEFRFDVARDHWGQWINDQFGEGIITWNTPFLFRTRPEGSRLLITGPANAFKANAQPLTAIIESDWMTMSFTMNWKLIAPGVPVRFAVGEPLFQAIPLAGNVGVDLEEAKVRYQKLADDPEVSRAYHEWSKTRDRFQEAKIQGELGPNDWQKDYFKGGDPSVRTPTPGHRMKLKPPRIQFEGTAAIEDYPKSLDRAKTAPAETVAPPPPPTAPIPLAVDDEWRRWIAENLMVDAPPANLIEAMVDAGIARPEAALEVDRASRSPYFQGSQLLRNRLRKRDWILETFRKLRRLDPAATEVARHHRLAREDFFRDYYVANRPVIITGMIDDWPALREWNLDYFESKFGGREVEVQYGREAGADYEIAREKYIKKIPFGRFIELIRTSGVTNDFYLTANNNDGNKRTLPELWEDIIQVPEYLDGRDPQSGFFWMGPAGTITPYHHDLTNNFMAQVVGRKRVRLAPSWDLPLMHNHFHVFSKIDGRTTPHHPRPQPEGPQILECILHPGEILFLPIGWMHFVEGLDVTVTMSFVNFLLDNDFHSTYSTYQLV